MDVDDYSTVLIVSVILAIFLYTVLFATAPFIAVLYKTPLLTALIRVMGLTLIINSVKAVVCAYIANRLEFRKFFMATIVGTLISAVVGITMATHGFGPWALVAQQMTNAAIDTILLLISTRIRFVFRISLDRLQSLFSFGWKMFASAVINDIYENISPLIIGLKYSATDLAFYTKGKLYPHYINAVISDTFSAVLFPVMSKLQDDKERLLYYTRSFVKTGAYFLFPMMIGFLAVSDNFIRILLTEKWMPASIYMKIFCISFMFTILTRGNLQAIKALGRSDIHLVLDIIKKTAYTIVLVSFLFLTDSPSKFAVAAIVNSLIGTFVNAVPNSKLLGYRIRYQIDDMLIPLIMSITMAIPVYCLRNITTNMFINFFLQLCTGLIIYLGLSIFMKPFGFEYGIKMVKEFAHRKN